MIESDPRIVIFRDDDLGDAEHAKKAYERYRLFVIAHELYNKYNIVHEIGYITGAQYTQADTTKYLLSQKNIVIQFHAHQHCDFRTLSERELRHQFEFGKKIIEEVFGKSPTKWYPPKHFWNEICANIASEYGLETPKIKPGSPDHFLRCTSQYINKTPPMTVCHHFWSENQQSMMEDAFKLYTKLVENHNKQK